MTITLSVLGLLALVAVGALYRRGRSRHDSAARTALVRDRMNRPDATADSLDATLISELAVNRLALAIALRAHSDLGEVDQALVDDALDVPDVQSLTDAQFDLALYLGTIRVVQHARNVLAAQIVDPTGIFAADLIAQEAKRAAGMLQPNDL